LKLLNASLRDADLIGHHVGRLRYAQPVCEPGFQSKIPAIQTEIAGLQIADTCFYYPEDRGIAESVRYGKMMAAAIDGESVEIAAA
ncbi:MAG: FAD-dependent oxidoreductase, partial [Pseudomonadota bacterium]